MKATDVFIPGSFPDETYIVRSDKDYENALADAFSIDGFVVSISGPSKSGKTVLVEQVVGKDNLITISGAGIKEPGNLWDSVLDWMEAPFEVQEVSKYTNKTGTEFGIKGGISVFGLGGGEVDAKAKLDSENGTETRSSTKRGGANQVIKELANSDYVILIDDFHYIPRDVQEVVAREIKDIVRNKVKICTATVSYRGDDVMRANPELRGRLQTIDLPYWSDDDLKKIATTGLKKLNWMVDDSSLNRFVKEAAGSPQLMQLICLQMCFVLNMRLEQDKHVNLNIDNQNLSAIFEQTSCSTDFRSLFDVLDCGPKLRGKERKIYSFIDHSEGDVYRCVLKAISADPPNLSFDYDSLLERTKKICTDDTPTGSSLSGSCSQMVKLALEHFPNERAIDWDSEKEILAIPDPYLLFYLRWSGRLLEKAN